MTFIPREARDVADHAILNVRFTKVNIAIQGALSPPVGFMVRFGGSATPSGWLPCVGSTTFNLPNMRGWTPIGAEQVGGLTNRPSAHQLRVKNHQLTNLNCLHMTSMPFTAGSAAVAR